MQMHQRKTFEMQTEDADAPALDLEQAIAKITQQAARMYP